jgi:hypothetical protein
MSTTTTHTTEMPANSSTVEHTTSSLSASTNSNATSNQSNGMGHGSNGSITTKAEAEMAAEKLYEERIEEEYAKREGGA